MSFMQTNVFELLLLLTVFTASGLAEKGCDGYWTEGLDNDCILTVQQAYDAATAESYCARKGGIFASGSSDSFTCTKAKIFVKNCAIVGNVDVTEEGIFLPRCVDEITPTMYIQRRNEPQVTLTYPHYMAQIKQLTLSRASWDAFKKRRTILVIHGYMSNSKGWVQDTGTALLKANDTNVMLFDWEKGAKSLDYLTSASNIRIMGRLVALIVDEIISLGLPETQVWCIGHSLGGQTCGSVGKHSINTIGRITGLDPAAPGFDDKSVQYRLNRNDATYVDVIHTGGNRDPVIPVINDYGTLIPSGHADFYPNGGMDQPGCTPSGNDGGCSHERSHQLFLETITSKSCTGGRWIPTNCTVITANMGYQWDQKTQGIFYSVTQGKSAFCESSAGMRLVDPSLPQDGAKIARCTKTNR